MKNSRIVRTAAVAAVLFATIGANAQSEASSKSIPLHVEASLGACTPSNKVLPLDVNVDLNYTFAKRFSLHATTTTSYFMPKNGATHDYNRATNLGGGLGYVFFLRRTTSLAISSCVRLLRHPLEAPTSRTPPIMLAFIGLDTPRSTDLCLR